MEPFQIKKAKKNAQTLAYVDFFLYFCSRFHARPLARGTLRALYKVKNGVS